MTFTTPTAPASYSWEATNEEVAARYGVPLERVVRFDLNTSPTPPELVTELLAAGRFETELSEYPPSDYRRLVEAAAARYDAAPDEILVGAGADEVLDVIAKACLPAGGAAVVPVPTYAMYRVVTEQRGATVLAVPRRPAADDWAIDVDAVVGGRPRGVGRLAVQPQQPDGAARTRRRHRGACSIASAPMPRPTAARPPSSCSTRPMPSSSDRRWPAFAGAIRTSSSSAPRARPTPSPACGSGSRSPGRRSSPA